MGGYKMHSFYDSEIIDIIPENLITNETCAISYAIKKAMQQLQKYALCTSVYTSIKEMPNEILDLMAIELNTQYYEEDMDRKTKEQLIINTEIGRAHV